MAEVGQAGKVLTRDGDGIVPVKSLQRWMQGFAK